MLTIENLSYSINHHVILRALNLQVDAGQFYALAGENGAGKSTLIKIIVDLIRNIDSGSIQIDGLDHKKLEARDVLTYLPEKFDIKKEVTGWQYLRFVSGVYQQTLDRDQVLSLCEQLALDGDRLEHKGSEYSKGMKQKLGLISCFMLNKPLIILDEPLSGLDPKARFLFKQLLQRERARKRSIFYSTHLLADAEEICDRFGILHRGQIVFNGAPAECLQQFDASTLEQAYMRCISA